MEELIPLNLSLTHGIIVNAAARGLQGIRERMTGVETDMREQVRESDCWETGLVSVETSWKRQATGIPTEGHPHAWMGQVPDVSQSPGDMNTNAGYQAPTQEAESEF